MNQKAFNNIMLILVFIALVGAGIYFVSSRQILPSIPNPIPIPTFECKKDSECPSIQYSCEAIQGDVTICPENDPSCISTSSITKGVCKLKEGSQCGTDSDCLGGLFCYANVCTRPIGRQCNGPEDTGCPAGFECMQSCGPIVPRGDEPPPPYFCQLKGYERPCPICLSSNTLIDTPSGLTQIKDMRIGMSIWTTDKSGHRVLGIVSKTSKVPAPSTHKMVRLILDDGRQLLVSPGHPTTDGRKIGDLKSGDLYDGASILSTQLISYDENSTYDLLPSGETGFYWANGILINSSLHSN